MLEIAYAGSRARQMLLKTNENQAPATLGVTNPNVNRPFFKIDPALGDLGTVTSNGFLNYNGLLVKFQRRFANGFSFMNSYTYGLIMDLSSDNDGGVALLNTYDPNYNRGPADYDIKHTFSSSWVYEIPWAHGEYYGMIAKYERLKDAEKNPFLDPDGYRAYVELKEKAFLATLAEQKGK